VLRKIRRNCERWLSKPFGKRRKPIELERPTIAPRPYRTKPYTRSLAEDQYFTVNSGYLMPIIPDIREYGAVLPAGGPDSTHDVVALMGGTLSQLLIQFQNFIVNQVPDTNSMAILAGATVTPRDAEVLARREQEQAYWVRHAERRGTGWVYLDNPPPHRFISSLIGNVASTGGNGGNQRKALRNLQTDAYTVPDILEFMKLVYRAFLDYAPSGCGLITAQGGGGSDPIHRYIVALLKDKLCVNRHYALYMLPTANEPLHIQNMKATLAYELEYEAANILHFLFQQQTAGAHNSDLAMVSGFITLSGDSKGRFNGGIDPTTKFNLIKETAGTWLTVTPKVVPLPLVPMGKVELVDGYRHEEHYQVGLPEELGGKRLSPIVDEINTMLAADPAAPHFITVAFSLNKDEMDYIANGVNRYPLDPGGQVHVFFNPCFASVDPVTNTAEALVCDFRGGSGVKACLNDFLLDKHSTPLTNGFSRNEQLVLAGKVAERSLTEEIERELQRILKKDHL
jgi:hypothetical protein